MIAMIPIPFIAAGIIALIIIYIKFFRGRRSAESIMNKKNAIPVKLYFVKTRDTWLSKECILNENNKQIVCGNNETYPLLSTYKIINEDKYVQIMLGNSKALMLKDEIGDYSTIDDPAAVEEAIASGLSKALERPQIWWQWLMLFIFGTLAGVGLGIVLGVMWVHPATNVIIHVNATGSGTMIPLP